MRIKFSGMRIDPRLHRICPFFDLSEMRVVLGGCSQARMHTRMNTVGFENLKRDAFKRRETSLHVLKVFPVNVRELCLNLEYFCYSNYLICSVFICK